MSKRRIPYKDLKKIKQNYREQRIETLMSDTDSEDSEIPVRKNELAAAKEAGKNLKINETGLTPKQLKKDAAKQMKRLKADFSGKNQVKATYNFDVGDLVSFLHNGKEEVGIVLDMNHPGALSTVSAAKSTGSVTLISSAGRVSILPIAVSQNLSAN